jgi:hypothetical protein
MMQLIAISTAGMLVMVSLIAGLVGIQGNVLVRLVAGLASLAGMAIGALLVLVSVAGGGL